MEPAESPMVLTEVLLDRVRRGERGAGDELFARFRPRLVTFIRLRLGGSSPALDPEDLAQDTVIRVMRSIDRFEHRGVGTFWSYVRTIAANVVRNALSRPVDGGLETSFASRSAAAPAAAGPTPSERVTSQEQIAAFDAALERIDARDREAVVLRLELDVPFERIAAECGFPSADAARMAVKRALERIAQEMGREPGR